jgi:hypothetical protein
MADIGTIIEALFGMGRATLIDALALFIIRFVFYVFAVCIIMFLCISWQKLLKDQYS